jgi:hypothetical protein
VWQEGGVDDCLWWGVLDGGIRNGKGEKGAYFEGAALLLWWI